MPENFSRTAKVCWHVDETVHQCGQERHQQGLGRGIIRALGIQIMKSWKINKHYIQVNPFLRRIELVTFQLPSYSRMSYSISILIFKCFECIHHHRPWFLRWLQKPQIARTAEMRTGCGWSCCRPRTVPSRNEVMAVWGRWAGNLDATHRHRPRRKGCTGLLRSASTTPVRKLPMSKLT